MQAGTNFPLALHGAFGHPGEVVKDLPATPNRIVRSLVFGRGGDAVNHQLGRWSHPEDGFTWSLAPGCGLRIPLAPSDDEVAVIVDVQPAWISPDRRSRKILVSLGGEVLLEVEISRRSTYLIAVGSFPDGGSIDLIFRFDEVPSLDKQEVRPLALAFRRVIVVEQSDRRRQERIVLPNIPLPEDKSGILKAVEATMSVSPETFVTTFESLGHSCDFGLFQRECGAEPLGLLRFGGISTPNLIEALVERFAGLGTPTNITVSPTAEWNDEYMVVDHAYELVSHTFVSEGQASPEQLIARELWRLPFLKRLFLEVLDGGLKTFVLRRPDHMHVSEALAIAAALRLHGHNVLLWAVQEEGLPPGSIEFVEPHLIRGYLDVTHGRGSASIQAWLSVCMNTRLALDGNGLELGGALPWAELRGASG